MCTSNRHCRMVVAEVVVVVNQFYLSSCMWSPEWNTTAAELFIYDHNPSPSSNQPQNHAAPCCRGPLSYSQTPLEEKRGRGRAKEKGQPGPEAFTPLSCCPRPAAGLAPPLPSLCLRNPPAAAGEVGGGAGVDALSLWYDGGGGGLHPLAACLASFFFGA